jgi:hypothetical protein
MDHKAQEEPDSQVAAPGAGVGEARGQIVVTDPIAKFLIAAFAVAAAGIVPRLVATLGRGSPADVVLVGFTKGYLMVTGLFALIVGVTLVILEWGVPRSPRETFMTALGIPAVLIGAFNTTVLTRQLDGLTQKTENALQRGASELGIPIESDGAPIEPLSTKPMNSSRLSALFVRPAHAGGRERLTHSAQLPNVGIQYAQPRYYVALDRAANQAAAEEKARNLRREYPEATAVKQGSAFLVVESTNPKLPSEALAIAARAQKSGLAPTLIQAR